MTTKKVMFAVMSLLLAAVIVLTGIVMTQINQLFHNLLKPGVSGSGPSVDGNHQQVIMPTKPSETDPSGPSEPTDPQQTDPTQPTQPPTVPTEPGHQHEYELTEIVEVTCELYGYRIYTCKTCGEQDIPLEEQTEPLGHLYGASEVVDPTCELGGFTRKTCLRCDHELIEREREPLGHDLVFIETVLPSCEVTGCDLYRCSRCQMEVQENVIEAVGHVFVPTSDPVLPTCTQDGSVSVRCTVCQQENQEVIPATGHTYGDWILEADGSMKRVCTTCLHEQTSAELRITSEQIREGGNSQLIQLTIGTLEEPELMKYTICDYLCNGTLRYQLDPVRGLVVTYTDLDGNTKELVRYFFEENPVVVS